jgi:hypothetical protein
MIAKVSEPIGSVAIIPLRFTTEQRRKYYTPLDALLFR